MSDQTVRITNLPKNEAEVGLELYKYLRATYAVADIEQDFALFSACVSAAKGYNYVVPRLTV